VEIVVTGRHGIAPELREYAEQKVAKVAQIFERVTSASVVLDAEGKGAVCRAEASVHVPRGTTLVAKAEAEDMRAALDALEARLLTQARKLKERLDGRRKVPGRGAA
jgi:ribosomal subunit interface protein